MAVNLNSLIAVIQSSWNMDTTAANPDDYECANNPALGQCAVTALIVQHFLGGDLLRCEIPVELGGSHYWNRLANGMEVDLTSGQFEHPIDRSGIIVRDRSYVLGNEITRQRYGILLEHVVSALTQ